MTAADYIAGAAAVGAIITTTATATWWLSRQFARIERIGTERHIENLRKFANLAMQIARLRWHLKIPDMPEINNSSENGG